MKLSLNGSWRYSLQMWKWIVERVRQDSSLKVEDLKDEWILKHSRFDGIDNNCFFCEYDIQQKKLCCSSCPGVLVDENFDCDAQGCVFSKRPIRFYEKLVALNKKRKAKL